MLTIKGLTNGAGYAAKHLAHSDYYAEGERVVGQWAGRGAQLLGLCGDVQFEQFEAIREGLDPSTGQFLRPRHGADRLAADGTVISRERNLYDFVFSAPKSVSILAELTGDDRLAAAHQAAVHETLAELESHAAARVRAAGANHDRTTGNLIMAVYHHDTSRELDPQLHTHAVAANLTFDGAEDRWKALQASPLYERRAYLTEVYRNSLARHIQELGYHIDDRFNAKKSDLSFEIAGVSDELVSKFSQRSHQRDQAIQEFIAANGRVPTDNEVAILVSESRAPKLIEISTPEVKARQLARLEPAERTALTSLRDSALTAPQNQHPLHSPAPSLEYAEAHLFERISVTRDYQLLTEALRHRRGSLDLSQLKATLTAQESSGQLLRAGTDVGTNNQLLHEQQMIALVDNGANRFAPLNDHFVPSTQLGPQRSHAVQFVLNSHDFAVNLSGAPGAGKTFSLQELHRGIQESGLQAVAVAPTTSAVEELHKVGFSDAITIERLLQDSRAQTAVQGKVLIIDEAGMVSGRQMLALLQTANDRGARVILSGDTKQIHSVESADALRILERHSKLKTTSLTKIERQTNLEYRAAVQELRRNPALGFDKLEQLGAIREVSLQERPDAIVRAYHAATAHINRHGLPSSVLVVAPTHEEIGRVTGAIRRDRKAQGELTNAITTDRYRSLQYTEAQKSDPRSYRPGHVLVFHRATKNAAKNQAFEVLGAASGKIRARAENGVEHEFSTRQVKSFNVFERREIEVAAGDPLLLTANRKDRDFKATNGELVSVSGFDEDGRIQLQDGRTLPSNFKHFAHGYAVTAHRAQGKTVDAVVISADSMPQELFHVAASRGRERIEIITGNKDALKESISISDQRESVTELASRIPKSDPHHNSRRNPIAAAAREETLSLPVQSPVIELETQNQPRQSLAPIQNLEPNKGIDYGIHH